MNLDAVQSALREAKLDGWLFYDHHHRDPIAYRILKIAPKMCTRRWYYLIPAEGEPAKLVHRIEKGNLDGLPGVTLVYSSWNEQRAHLKKILAEKKTVAMQYSPLNDIPYVGLVDAGTLELVKSFGVNVVSSADLVQLFEARWSPEALALHLEAGKAVHAIIRDAFGLIRDAVRAAKSIGEYDVQQEILRLFAVYDIEADDPPIVSVNENSADPHYSPTRASSRPIRANDFVLMDVWAKVKKPGAVYFDITWTGFVGEQVPQNYTEVFDVVREARDAAIDLVKRARREGRPLRGYQVDDAARGVITRHGYGDYFVHRTGHSIGEDIHGTGANMDDFETRDDRRIIPATCFSVEPGIYLPEFGVRSEVNVYVEEREARVTGEIQNAVVAILAGAQ
ncbi:MAG: M24 family metallopeptidase [Acidobacteria bacterium]|nr:M24 family metallopeptidase [Acidobacteriota bacterium]